ncbi:hypothetical protein ACQEUU_19155 [Nonomuraea sp. CA-218870]|uniref:hypothetical protein n=1 Tax=Nonomuraea sp. CA-218870 TaxID=3239998 RepID=UPI003D8CCFC3
MTPLERALETVIADLPPELRARHRFHFTDRRRSCSWLALEDGRYWSGGAYLPRGADDVATVAECMQDLLMEVLWIVWPECPKHGFGLHVKVDARQPVWLCEGAAHVVAPIGALRASADGA